MRGWMSTVCAVLAALTVVVEVYADEPNPPSVSILEVGTRAPKLSVDLWLKGDSIPALRKGQVYLVEFWGTWCGPCIKSIPHLNKVYNLYNDSGLTVIGVASHEFNGLDPVKKFVAAKGDSMAYAIAYDSDLSMEHDWQSGGQKDVLFRMPEAFVIDGSGIIAWKGHPAHEDEMDEAIHKALAKAAKTK